jgi:hypothetical protein
MDTIRNLIALVLAIPAVAFGLYVLYDLMRFVTTGSGWYLSRAVAASLLFALCSGLVQAARPNAADS